MTVLDADRTHMLRVARGEIDSDDALAFVRTMKATRDHWADQDVELAQALDAGDAAFPGDQRRQPKEDDMLPTVDPDEGTMAAFDELVQPNGNGHKPGHPLYRATRLSDVEPEQVGWLWPRRLPLGKLVTFIGDPDVGKSTVSLDLTARVTTGRPMPGEEYASVPPSAVVWMTAEDALGDTVRPRHDAAGGDAALVYHLDVAYRFDDEERQWGEAWPTIPEDLPALEALIVDTGAVLVFVDVLFSYLSGRVKASSDQDVRRALAPLAALAERTGACVVLIAHIPKSQRHGSSAITATPGAMGVGGSARSGMMAASDPDDETGVQRVLARTKGNLAPPWPSMAYRLLCSTCGEPVCDATDHGPAVVEWLGESTHSGASLLAPRQDDDDRSALDEAQDWLGAVLSLPRLKREIVKEARSEGITDMTLKRAAKELGVVSKRDDGLQGRPATWSLPGYGSRVMGQEGMTHNLQPSDQGKQAQIEGYGSRPEHDPKPSVVAPSGPDPRIDTEEW